MILTKRQTLCVLTFCVISVILVLIAMSKSDYIEPEKFEPIIKEPSVITVTPLDSPNSCYSQDWYTRVE